MQTQKTCISAEYNIQYSVCCCAGLSAVFALAVAKHCEYGSMPGHIVVSSTNIFPMQWEQLDPDCAMTSELNKYLGLDPTGQAAVQDRDISFLMYGDASDGFMAKDVCDVSASRWLSSTSCSLRLLALTQLCNAAGGTDGPESSVWAKGPVALLLIEGVAPGQSAHSGRATSGPVRDGLQRGRLAQQEHPAGERPFERIPAELGASTTRGFQQFLCLSEAVSCLVCRAWRASRP